MVEPQAPRILIVDDMTICRRVLSRVLNTLGFDVVEAKHGKEAFEYLSMQHSDIRLTFMDLCMPVQDGFECTRNIRQLEKDMSLRRMPIVACTANYLNAQTSGDLVENCVKDCDMDDCIGKPLSVDLLAGLLKKHLPDFTLPKTWKPAAPAQDSAAVKLKDEARRVLMQLSADNTRQKNEAQIAPRRSLDIHHMPASRKKVRSSANTGPDFRRGSCDTDCLVSINC
eukprot:jgi/Botrbrau1/6713/Bobra.0324s0004.1